MGAYVFGVAGPSHVFKARLRDEVVEVGKLAYRYKPWGGYDGAKRNAAAWARYGMPAVRAWASKVKPRFFVPSHGDNLEVVGDAVLLWHPDREAVVDDPNWSGLCIGVMRKIGVEYIIEPNAAYLEKILASGGF